MDESIMYSEVYSILSILGNDYISKIPRELYEYIKNKRNKDYEKKIDRFKSIGEQGFSNKTIEFIAFLNLDFWADEKQKQELTKIYTENDRKYEEELRKKYMPNGIQDPFGQSNSLRNNTSTTSDSVDSSMEIAIINEKENIFKRFINRIKSIFK